MTQALGVAPAGLALIIVVLAGLALIAGFLAVVAISRRVAGRALGGPHVSVSGTIVRAGEPITVSVHIQPNAPVVISGIYAEVHCTEEVETGSDGEVRRTTVYRRQEWLLSSYRPMKAGMSAHHGAALIFPANATPTGEAGSTRTVWSLGVVVELDGRPGWSTKLPLTVLP